MAENESCGRAVISLLEAYGVDTVFGMPGDLSAAEQQGVRTRIMEIMTAHPNQAARIREVAEQAGLRIDGR